jgi:hypothetical protein
MFQTAAAIYWMRHQWAGNMTDVHAKQQLMATTRKTRAVQEKDNI